MISVRQIRAARGMLGWSQSVLAAKAGLSRSTIARLELAETAPHDGTVESIYTALTAHGVTFVQDPANGIEGVQLRIPPAARRP
jgi:transcriptional regulator with XRE-family HTH domain